MLLIKFNRILVCQFLALFQQLIEMARNDIKRLLRSARLVHLTVLNRPIEHLNLHQHQLGVFKLQLNLLFLLVAYDFIDNLQHQFELFASQLQKLFGEFALIALVLNVLLGLCLHLFVGAVVFRVRFHVQIDLPLDSFADELLLLVCKLKI